MHPPPSGYVDRKLERVLSLNNAYHSVPTPCAKNNASSSASASTSFDATATLAAVDLLRQDIDVYDPDVFAFCQRFTATHKSEHSRMSRDHAKLEEQRIQDIPSVRRRWHLILNVGQRSSAGAVVIYIEGLVVLASIVTIIMESIPYYSGEVDESYETLWLALEIVLTLYFIILTVVRFAVSPSVKYIVRSPMNWFDVMSILPLFVQLAVTSRDWGWLKMLRMFRIVKLLRAFQYIDALAETLRRIASSLVAPFALLAAFVVIFGNVIYWVESGSLWTLEAAQKFINETNYTNASAILAMVNTTVLSDCMCESTAAFLFNKEVCPPLPTQFISAVQGMWYAVASFTTVGYGDLVPVCAPGKMVTSIALLFSTIFIAMPIAIVGASFTETVLDHHNKIMLHKKLKARTMRDLKESQRIQDEEAALRNEALSGKRRKRNRRAAIGSQAQKQISAAEALFRFVASQLQTEQLDFTVSDGVSAHDVNADSALTASMQQDRYRGDESVYSSIEPPLISSAVALLTATGVPHIAFTDLPVAARYRSALVDTVNAYIAWLFEYWLMDALDDTNGFDYSMSSAMASQVSLINPFARRTSTKQSDFQRSVLRQQKADEIRVARKKIRDVLTKKIGSLHPLLLLQALDRPVGFTRQVHLISRHCVDVFGNRASDMEENGSATTTPQGSRASLVGSTACGPLVLRCDDLWLPDIIGRFEVATLFAARQLRFLPHAAAIDNISINGQPLVDLAATQYLSKLRHAQHDANPTKESKELLKSVPTPHAIKTTVRSLRIAAAVADAHSHGLGLQGRRQAQQEVVGGSYSVYGVGASEGTMMERVFAVQLKHGDVVDFTSQLRTRDDVAHPAVAISSLAKSKARSASIHELQVAENVVLENMLKRAAELERSGVVPITYRIVASTSV